MKKERIRQNKHSIKVLLSNGFRKPFQILVDSSFIRTINSLENGVGVLKDTLQDYPKYFIPKCEYDKYRMFVEKELSRKGSNSESGGKDYKNSLRSFGVDGSLTGADFSGQCEIIKCSSHRRNPIASNDKNANSMDEADKNHVDDTDGCAKLEHHDSPTKDKKIAHDCYSQILGDTNPHHFILATTNTKRIYQFRDHSKLPLLKVMRWVPFIDVKGLKRILIENKGKPAGEKELRRLRQLFE